MTNKEKVNLYLDYINNYLSVNTFALNNYGILATYIRQEYVKSLKAGVKN